MIQTLRRGLKLSLALILSISILSACSDGNNEDPAITQIKAFIGKQTIDKASVGWKSLLTMPPKLKFTEGKDYFWLLRTSHGNMKIKFMPQYAPMHVSSTIYLTELGFYDDIAFHRVIPDFMAQGGDPLGNGSGGPGYKYAGEFHVDAKHDSVGVLSMANAGPNTDGSQFFITFKPTPHLNNRHTVFGKLVEGEDTLRKIEKEGSPYGKTRSPVKIIKALIVVEDKQAEKK